MDGATMNIYGFLSVYLLLFVIASLMKASKVNQGKLLFIAGLRMSLQLIVAGFVLTYIFKSAHPVLTFSYLGATLGYTIHIVFKQNPGLSSRFKWYVAGSIAVSGIAVLLYFLYLVMSSSILEPRYAITIYGMIMGNTMTGSSLAIKTLRKSLEGRHSEIQALLCFGASPKQILVPFSRNALEAALLPTLNNMIGMGIVSLPGMMTGQILSGAVPMTAIMYQIAIMIAICTAVTSSAFGILFLGTASLYDKEAMT